MGYGGVHRGCFALESTSGKKYVYRVTKQTAKTKQDTVGVECVKHLNGKLSVGND